MDNAWILVSIIVPSAASFHDHILLPIILAVVLGLGGLLGGLGDTAITALHAFGSDGLRPDRVILLEGDEAALAGRLAARGAEADAIEGRSSAYHRAVADAFAGIAASDPDALASPEKSYFHDLSFVSAGVIADSFHGGLRRDLSRFAARHDGLMLEDKGVTLEPEFMLERVDTEAKALVSYDEREVPYDLLVTIPLNMGADFVARSGLGDDLNYVSVDKHTLLSTKYDNIFALGDASNIPASKAGSVAHFSIDLFPENFINHVNGRPMTAAFDGHANCFIESGRGKGMLIDFNYDTEPLPGKYPIPGIGPFSLLKETELNHLGKLAFRWMYWNLLLPGKELPLPALMSMAGKQTDVLERV